MALARSSTTREETSSGQASKLTTVVIALIMSLVIQDISRLSTYGSPLIHFLAVYGVNPTTRTFLLVFSYTPILA